MHHRGKDLPVARADSERVFAATFRLDHETTSRSVHGERRAAGAGPASGSAAGSVGARSRAEKQQTQFDPAPPPFEGRSADRETTRHTFRPEMSQTNFDPSTPAGTEIRIGLVVEDQRTGDLRKVIYADSRTVLLRDERGSTTLLPRDSFESDCGTRYRTRHDVDPPIEAGQYDALRRRLAEYEGQPGRKAKHKLDALTEALDLLGGVDEESVPTDTGDSNGEKRDGEDGGSDEVEVRFEDIDGIGPATAGRLRMQGFVTARDVRTASDEDVLAVSGVGPESLERIRAFVE